MHQPNPIRAHFTVAGQKLPAWLSKGFTLLESVVALFILTLIVTVVLKHQALMIKTQAQASDSAAQIRRERNAWMMRQHGMSLLELVAVLAISSILFLVIDQVFANLWLTRAKLEQAQETTQNRAMPQQLFAELLYHAGALGCRAVHDGLEIKAPPQVPAEIFIQQGRAVRIDTKTLWVHDTTSHAITYQDPVPEQSIIKPVSLADKSDWLLVSDCERAELLPYGGQTTQSYQPPVYVAAITVARWYLKDQILYRHQTMPNKPAQPVLAPVLDWQWEKRGSLLRLSWQIIPQWDEFIFELANSPC